VVALSACNMGLSLAQVHLTGQMRRSHYVEYSNSPLRVSRFGFGGFFLKKFFEKFQKNY
jgi:hypothetical protein